MNRPRISSGNLAPRHGLSVRLISTVAAAIALSACGEKGHYDPELHEPGRGWQTPSASASQEIPAPAPSESPEAVATPESPNDPHAATRRTIAHQFENCSIDWQVNGRRLELTSVNFARNKESLDARAANKNSDDISWNDPTLAVGHIGEDGKVVGVNYPVNITRRGGGFNNTDPSSAVITTPANPKKDTWFGVYAISNAMSELDNGENITTYEAVLCGINGSPSAIRFDGQTWRPAPMPDGMEPRIIAES